MESKKLLPIGTKVFDIRFGWGEVIKAINNTKLFPIYVSFEKRNVDYTIDGLYNKGEINPTLSLTEYNLINGGFTPITDFDFDAPKVGDVGYFWDKEEQFTLSYSRIKEILKYGFLNQNKTEWRYFSKEVPQWFKDKMSDQ